MPTLRYTADEVLSASTQYFNGDELAASTFLNKYALSKVIDGIKLYAELTPDDMHKRLAREFAAIEQRYPEPFTEAQIYDAIRNFTYIVPQGSPMYAIGNPFVRASTSNCVVVASPADNISGIMESGKDLANLFKRRAGVGIDISTLRPEGASVSNAAGTSTGAYSFAEHFSNVCRLIGQNGRRGALMITIDVRHPDVEKFAKMKRDLTKVTGANISIILTDDFMRAVESKGTWITRWPIEAPIEEAKVTKTYNAEELWHTINESAWLSAEPGLIFGDNYRKNLPAHYYPGFEFLTVNPCSEIGLSAYDSCRLISLNLKNFVLDPYTEKARFDKVHFMAMTSLGARLADDLVDIEIDYLAKIIEMADEEEEKVLWTKLRESAINGRRVGLGTHGLADMLTALGLRYDSDEAMKVVDTVYSTFRNHAYRTSLVLAEQRGAFPAWETGDDRRCEFLIRWGKTERFDTVKPRRNIAMLTMAPTGSVSILSQSSSGIEPVFANSYTRRKKINPSDTTSRVDFTDNMGDKWQHFTVYHHAVEEFMAANPGAELPDYFVTAEAIDPMRRVEIQSIIQKYIDHGISSTINLPKDASIDLVEQLYMEAWKKGLKGVTVYRDGSRSGVLVHTDAEEEILETRAPKRPVDLKCAIHRVKISSKKGEDVEDWTVIVGFLGGKPYEVFGGPSQYMELPKKITSGKLYKRKCSKANSKGRINCYDLIIGEGDDEMKIKDIASIFTPEHEDYGLITRMLSLQLRHGVPIHFIVEQLQRDPDATIYSFAKVMARVLKKYVADGVKSGENCGTCNSKLVFEDGCFACKQCGGSKCS